jgi:hypothetical protein
MGIFVAHDHGVRVDVTSRINCSHVGIREIPDNAYKGFKHIEYGKWLQLPPHMEDNLKYKNFSCLNDLFSVSYVRTVFSFRLGISGLICKSMPSTNHDRITRHCSRSDLHVLFCPYLDFLFGLNSLRCSEDKSV